MTVYLDFRDWWVTGVSGPAAERQSHKPPHIHVETGPCRLRHCGWSGFHFHWRHRRFRSFRALSMVESAQLDAELVAAHHPGWEAGR